MSENKNAQERQVVKNMSKAFSEEQEERIRQIVREERNKFALEEMKAIYPRGFLQELQKQIPALKFDLPE